MYRCPLCLNKVADSDRFVRYCPQHPGSTVELTGQDLAGSDLQAALCSEPGCSSAAVVNTTGLLIRHVDCHIGVSPFRAGPVVRAFKGNPLRHWELLILEDIAKSVKEGPAGKPWIPLISGTEMVFPYGLLVRQDPYGALPPSHVLVGVLGAKNAGKTFLSLHLADLQGYGRSSLPPPRDYLYTVPGDGSGAHEDFLNTLFLRQLLETNQDFRTHLAATTERSLNLKAGLFPRETLENWLLGRRKSVSTAVAMGRRPGRFMSFLIEIWASLKRIVTVPDATDGVGSAYCSLLLYDIAGEAVMAGDSRAVDEHLNAMDLNAVLVSAEDILNDNKSGALDVANNLLERLRGWKTVRGSQTPARVALVVTKLDLGPDVLRKLSAVGSTSDLRRQALAEALATLQSPGARTLARLLRTSGSHTLVDRVFFINPEIAQGYFFEIHGLSELVRWCFDPRAN